MVAVVSFAAIATTLIALPASAATLSGSFSGGTSTKCVKVGLMGDYYTKSCWASTNGYSGYHYVRAYIGGTSSSTSNTWADTGRQYSYGNIKTTCTTSSLFVGYSSSVSLSFPTGYAKYGSS